MHLPIVVFNYTQALFIRQSHVYSVVVFLMRNHNGVIIETDIKSRRLLCVGIKLTYSLPVICLDGLSKLLH